MKYQAADLPAPDKRQDPQANRLRPGREIGPQRLITLERHMKPLLTRPISLAGWLLLSYAAAVGGGVASADAGSLYERLVRPAWAPPGWLFAPVWSVLYALMGIAAWLVWQARGSRRVAVALGFFVAQLSANALWTWLFFAWRRGALASAEVLLLWSLLLATVIAFGRVRPLAGALLIPYLFWVSFASVLTCSLWQLNPGLLR